MGGKSEQNQSGLIEWLQTIPGIIASIATLITAIGGLIILTNNHNIQSKGASIPIVTTSIKDTVASPVDPLNKIMGNWKVIWHSLTANKDLDGNLNFEKDEGQNDNYSIKGHIQSAFYQAGLRFDADFTGKYMNKHLSFFVNTPCTGSTQNYSLTYNDTRDDFLGEYRNEGGDPNCTGRESGTMTLTR